MIAIDHLWNSLGATTLVWLVVTLAAYTAGNALQRACGGATLANPVLIAITIVAAIVIVTRTDYTVYFTAAQFINFLLGPATVALAIPLARSARLVKENLAGVGLALLAGSVTSTVSGVGLVWRFTRGCPFHGAEGRDHSHCCRGVEPDRRNSSPDSRACDRRWHRGGCCWSDDADQVEGQRLAGSWPRCRSCRKRHCGRGSSRAQRAWSRIRCAWHRTQRRPGWNRRAARCAVLEVMKSIFAPRGTITAT